MNEYSEKAKELFTSGYNCSQSVLVPFCEKTGIDRETAIKLASSFGGGMGRLREVCGAVSAMFMISGFIYGSDDPLDKEAKTANYELIQRLAAEFKEKTGSIICRELLGMQEGPDDPVPADRTAEYYAGRPCAELVEIAAGIIGDYIKNNAPLENE